MPVCVNKVKNNRQIFQFRVILTSCSIGWNEKNNSLNLLKNILVITFSWMKYLSAEKMEVNGFEGSDGEIEILAEVERNITVKRTATAWKLNLPKDCLVVKSKSKFELYRELKQANSKIAQQKEIILDLQQKLKYESNQLREANARILEQEDLIGELKLERENLNLKNSLVIEHKSKSVKSSVVTIETQTEDDLIDDDTSSISSTSTLSLFSPVSPITHQKDDDKVENDTLSSSSTASIIKHVMDITKRGFKTKYCTCGSKFKSREKLNEHLELYRSVYYNYDNDDLAQMEEDEEDYEFNEEEYLNNFCKDRDYRTRARLT